MPSIKHEIISEDKEDKEEGKIPESFNFVLKYSKGLIFNPGDGSPEEMKTLLVKSPTYRHRKKLQKVDNVLHRAKMGMQAQVFASLDDEMIEKAQKMADEKPKDEEDTSHSSIIRGSEFLDEFIKRFGSLMEEISYPNSSNVMLTKSLYDMINLRDLYALSDKFINSFLSF
jgi:hypothetical protein